MKLAAAITFGVLMAFSAQLVLSVLVLMAQYADPTIPDGLVDLVSTLGALWFGVWAAQPIARGALR